MAPIPAWITSWLPVITYMAMLFGFSSLSRLPSPPGELSYYHVHVAAYAVLGALAARALSTGMLRNVTWRIICLAIAISSLYGVTDEYHQLFVPGRTFEWWDIVADTIGSVLGAGSLGAWSIIRARSEARDVV